MSTPVRPTLAASIAVFREDGRVLVAQRTKPPAEGVWSLPGGRVEPGETLGQAALRELMEEVGVEAQLLGFNRHVESIGRGRDGAVTHHFVVASFVGRWLHGEAMAGPEAGDVRWIDADGLGGLAVTRDLPEVIASARALWQLSR